jgi:hypothetical protein
MICKGKERSIGDQRRPRAREEKKAYLCEHIRRLFPLTISRQACYSQRNKPRSRRPHLERVRSSEGSRVFWRLSEEVGEREIGVTSLVDGLASEH